MAAPVGVLSLALDFVTTEVAASSASGGGSIEESLTHLPMVLVEDFLESQGREACTQFWSKWVEPNAARLTAAPLVSGGGKYTLIRLCKKLAQRMSKTHDSSFCGQIHLFLSKALTFFERSGLNVTGGLNLDNVTAFEDEEQFRRAMLGFDGEDEAGAVSASAGGAATVATAGGGENGGGDAMDVDAGGGGKGEGDDKEEGEFAVDYRLYQAFWRLQKYALKQDAAVKGAGAKDTWNAILGDVDKILDAFEANAFSEHDLRLARERWMGSGGGGGGGAVANSGSSSKRRRVSDVMELEANGAATGEGGGYFGLKYLTSSRLLRLQLRDPTLRLQVLTQWLILAASLKIKVGKDKDSPNSAADLNPRMERAKRLVKATPPRGEEYLNMLQTVLHRESAWTQWKDVDKCKDIPAVPVGEAKSAAAAAAAGVVAAAPSYPNKRQRPQASVALAERAKHAPLGADFPLEKMVSRLHAGVPSPAEHLEDQRMCAEDPDIPSTELPSAGPLYAWRALRLLGKESPANLAGCYDGDLVAAMDRLDKARNAAEAAEAEAKSGSDNAAAAAAAEAAAAAVAATAAAATAAAATETTGEKSQQPLPSAVASSTKGEVEDATATAMAVDGEGEEEEGEEEEGEVELTRSGGTDANGSAAVEGSGDGAEDKEDKITGATAAGASPSSPRAAATTATAGGTDAVASPDSDAGAASDKSNSGTVAGRVAGGGGGGGAAIGWLPEKVSTPTAAAAAAASAAAAGQPSPIAGEGSGRRKASKNAPEPLTVVAPTTAAAATKAAGSPRSPRLTRRRSKKEENGSAGTN